MKRDAAEPPSPALKGLIGQLRSAVRELYPGALTPEEAADLVESFAEGERVCAAGEGHRGSRRRAIGNVASTGT